MNEIEKVTGITKEDFKNYAQDQCHVCGTFTCENGLFNEVEKCNKFNPIKPITEWWLELQREIYENETPWADEDGNILTDTDSTAEILEELRTDYLVKSEHIARWASGKDAATAIKEYLEAQEM